MLPTERFSSRVEHYIRYRPGYPREIIRTLAADYGLGPHSIIADIGSGPGQLTRLFLEAGCYTYGIEPNEPMRLAGEMLLAEFPNFTSLAGTAEQTILPNNSVDMVTAGQAAHWFEPESACAEFRRILRPDGFLVLVWNERQYSDNEFQRDYEKLLNQYGTDYAQVSHRKLSDPREHFFADQRCVAYYFQHAQSFDLESLQGRLLSSSYVPEVGHPSYEPMIADLHTLFAQYQQEGKVEFNYITRMYVGKPA